MPNLISGIGFGLVVAGAFAVETLAGLLAIIAGRLLDLADGWVARQIRQSSRLGAMLDATLDKLAGLAIIIALWNAGMAPKAALVAIVVHNLLNAIITASTAKRQPDRKLVPSLHGKYAMAAQNAALAAYAVSFFVASSSPLTGHMLYLSGHAATVFGVIIFGLPATLGYLKRLRGAM